MEVRERINDSQDFYLNHSKDSGAIYSDGIDMVSGKWEVALSGLRAHNC